MAGSGWPTKLLTSEAGAVITEARSTQIGGLSLLLIAALLAVAGWIGLRIGTAEERARFLTLERESVCRDAAVSAERLLERTAAIKADGVIIQGQISGLNGSLVELRSHVVEGNKK